VMRHYTADNGGWYEGPGYWDYTTSYNMVLMPGLESALGSDFSLSDTRAVWQTGSFAEYLVGPTRLSFNFADANAGKLRGPQLLWLARRYDLPELAWHQRNNSSPEVLDLLWYDARGADPQASGWPADNYFRGPTGTTPYYPADALTLRSRWLDSDATFVGFKAGEIGASHGHLDAGSFVLDALGHRWAHDLGGDDYALPAYFGNLRWTYYRLRAEGHNTLVINPDANPDQNVGARPPIILYSTEPNSERSAAIADLTGAYNNVTRVWRGIALCNGRRDVLVQDEIQAAVPATVWWFMHINTNTSAQVATDGSSVMLTQGADRLWLQIISGGGTFALSNAVPLPTSPNPAGQNPNTGYRKLAIRLAGVTNTTLAVLLTPLRPGENPPLNPPEIIPLNQWDGIGIIRPAAASTNATATEDNVFDLDLRSLVADTGVPLDQLQFSVGDATNGSVTLLSDGYTARFAPASNYFGPASFSYTVTDHRPDPDLLLAYDFEPPEDLSDNRVTDASPNGRDATIRKLGTGAALLDTDVPAPLKPFDTQSLRLTESPGTNNAEICRLVPTNEFDFSDHDWTYTGWFKRANTNSDDFIFYIGNSDGFGSPEELQLYCSAGHDSLQLRHYIAQSTTDISLSAGGIGTGEWHHAAITFQRTNLDTGILNFYVDGAWAGSAAGFTFHLDQNGPLVFGGHNRTNYMTERWFGGNLDEQAVFGAALGAGQIGGLATGTLSRFGNPSATSSVSLNVLPVNDPPRAGPGSTSTLWNSSRDVDLWTLAGDVETAESNLLFAVSGAINGVVSLLPDGHTARFIPAPDFTGTADFTYTVTDLAEDPRALVHYSLAPPETLADNLVTDATGKGHDGALTAFGAGSFALSSLVPAAIAADLGASLALNELGSNGAARVQFSLDTNEFNLSDNGWTFAGWIQRFATTNDDFVFYSGNGDGFGGNGDEFQLYCPSGQNSVRVRHYNTANILDLQITSASTIGTGQWHHVALAFDRTTANTGSLRLYTDGTLSVTSTNLTWTLQQSAPLTVGGHDSGGRVERDWNGRLADVVLFSSALGGPEISRLATHAVMRFGGATTTNTVAVTVLAAYAPPLLGAPLWSNGIFSLSVDGPAGPAYVVQASTNLLDWMPVLTNRPIAPPFPFDDPGAGAFACRFYRVLLQN
jgi:Concanavalin A-like lectin/glucanases superfamily/Heparinase II/III-like protein/Bacterial Ig domain